jgi:hypothetical protein
VLANQADLVEDQLSMHSWPLDTQEASQLSFDFRHPPRPRNPNHLNHYEKALFNHAYWYLVPPGLV